eukprot:ANDGO_04506.mRNA.1 hypothetical protein
MAVPYSTLPHQIGDALSFDFSFQKSYPVICSSMAWALRTGYILDQDFLTRVVHAAITSSDVRMKALFRSICIAEGPHFSVCFPLEFTDFRRLILDPCVIALSRNGLVGGSCVLEESCLALQKDPEVLKKWCVSSGLRQHAAVLLEEHKRFFKTPLHCADLAVELRKSADLSREFVTSRRALGGLIGACFAAGGRFRDGLLSELKSLGEAYLSESSALSYHIPWLSCLITDMGSCIDGQRMLIYSLLQPLCPRVEFVLEQPCTAKLISTAIRSVRFKEFSEMSLGMYAVGIVNLMMQAIDLQPGPNAVEKFHRFSEYLSSRIDMSEHWEEWSSLTTIAEGLVRVFEERLAALIEQQQQEGEEGGEVNAPAE